MKTILLALTAFAFFGCATATQWQAQLAPDSLANKAIVSVAEHYGGQKAAELASAGLYAAADVLQGYVDKKPPLDVVTQSPGVEGVGHLLVNFLKDKGVIKQGTVDSLHKAAEFAAKVTYVPKSTVKDGP